MRCPGHQHSSSSPLLWRCCHVAAVPARARVQGGPEKVSIPAVTCCAMFYAFYPNLCFCWKVSLDKESVLFNTTEMFPRESNVRKGGYLVSTCWSAACVPLEFCWCVSACAHVRARAHKHAHTQDMQFFRLLALLPYRAHAETLKFGSGMLSSTRPPAKL
eukprot:1137212-Pelagomonas_calceolata.AAC.5